MGECPEGQCVQGIDENGELICSPCDPSSGCDPATTTRIGQWCVENILRGINPEANDPPKNFVDASRDCHAVGRSICPIDALMLCDVLDDDAGSQASCRITTDSNILRLWTSTYDASYGESVFQSIVVYGQDNKAFKASVTDIFPFYCCESVDNP
jgi:hypothetical protein